MKLITLLLLTVLAVIAGCTSVEPKNDQQTVYTFGGSTIATALIAADTYQSLNLCSKPGHTVPCSDSATSDRIQDAKVKLVAAYKQADAVVNDPAYTADKFAKAQLILSAALTFLISITPPAG